MSKEKISYTEEFKTQIVALYNNGKPASDNGTFYQYTMSNVTG